jgi:hypothetical protein
MARTSLHISIHGLPSICSVDTDFVDLLGILAEVFDVPKYMPSTVLTDKIA